MYIHVRGGHWEDVITSYPGAGPGKPEALPSLLCPWNVCSICLPMLGTTQGHRLEIVMWCWDHLDCIHDWIQVRFLYEHLRFWQMKRRDLPILQPPKTTLGCKFPCLLNSPPTNLEWATSFLGLFLPSVYGDQFQIIPRSSQLIVPLTWITITIMKCHYLSCTSKTCFI